MSDFRSGLYECRVGHARLDAVRNRFEYGMYLLALDLDELDGLNDSLRHFARNQWALFSFRDEDHGAFLDYDASPDDASPSAAAERPNLRQRITAFVQERGDFTPARVVLVTSVRVLGYVFNPVCFYYCYDEADELRFVVAEVNNTFGVQAAYLLKCPPASVAVRPGSFPYVVPKILHVSPFLEADHDFAFDFDPPGDKMRMLIDSLKNDEPVLRAVLNGKRLEFTDANLLRLFFRYPLVTVMVIVRIHWQALKIFWKGGRYRTMGRVHGGITERLGKRPNWWKAVAGTREPVATANKS